MGLGSAISAVVRDNSSGVPNAGPQVERSIQAVEPGPPVLGAVLQRRQTIDDGSERPCRCDRVGPVDATPLAPVPLRRPDPGHRGIGEGATRNHSAATLL